MDLAVRDWSDLAILGGLVSPVLAFTWRSHRRTMRIHDLVERELRSNQGESLRDRVLLIQHGLGSLTEQVTRLNGRVDVRIDRVEQEQAHIWQSLAARSAGRRAEDRDVEDE